MLRRLLAIVIVASLAVVLGARVALAGGGCAPGTTPTVGAGLGSICVPARDPGAASRPGSSSGPPARASSAGPAGCFKTGGAQVPCSSHLGVWSGSNQCYAAPYDAPSGSAAWQGHSTGSLSLCSACTMSGRVNSCDARVLWSAPGQVIVPPDPGELAAEALGLLQLRTAEVHTAPQTPAHSYVGVENWLWVPRSQWSTLTKTVSAGGTQVTVSAAPRRVLWHTGAATKSCFGPGEEWRAGMTDAARTSCSYTYDATSGNQPGGVYALSASIGYEVTWVCTGACTSGSGSLGLVDAPAGAGELRVLQRQTVVVG